LRNKKIWYRHLQIPNYSCIISLSQSYARASGMSTPAGTVPARSGCWYACASFEHASGGVVKRISLFKMMQNGSGHVCFQALPELFHFRETRERLHQPARRGRRHGWKRGGEAGIGIMHGLFFYLAVNVCIKLFIFIFLIIGKKEVQVFEYGNE